MRRKASSIIGARGSAGGQAALDPFVTDPLRFAASGDGSMCHATADLTFTAADEDDKEAIPKFKIVANTGAQMILPNRFFPVILDMSGGEAPARGMPVLQHHQIDRIVGHSTSIDIKKSSVVVAGAVSGVGEAAEEVVATSKRGFKWQASLGWRVEREEFVKPGASARVNGKTVRGPVNIHRKWKPHEVSFVPIGADGNTDAKVAASAITRQEAQAMFEQWLKERGFEASALTDEQTKHLKAQYDAEQKAAAAAEGGTESGATPPAPESKPPTGAEEAQAAGTADNSTDAAQAGVEGYRRAIAAENSRIAAIRKHCAGKHDELEAKAIADGWSAEKTELEVLRASRPSAPFVATSGASQGGAPSAEVIVAAACMAGGLNDFEKAFEEKTLDAADKRYKGQIGLQEMLLEAAWANGYRGTSVTRDVRGVLEAAFSGSFSTFSLPGILSNVANKFLLQAFMAVEDTWRRVSKVGSVRDFKKITRYRLTGDMVYEKVGADGELKHGKLGEESFENQAETYGKMFSITRKDIINDDLGALTDVPRRLGRGAALALNTIFWTEFLDNLAFFVAGNNNVITGASSAFSIDALTALEKLFLDQVDPDGNPLAIDPKILLVPNALWVPANQVMSSLELREDGNASKSKFPTKNPHAGKFTPERSSYLSNASIPNSSPTAWYLLADPEDLPVIETVFLNGRQAPVIEQAAADFNVLGVQMRGFHDMGVKKQEHRAGAKADGA